MLFRSGLPWCSGSSLETRRTNWYASEGTLSIHSIRTPKREAFYWLAILFTFALGTAAGDLIAEHLNLGYWKSALLFAGSIGIVAYIAYTEQGVAFVLVTLAVVPLEDLRAETLVRPVTLAELRSRLRGYALESKPPVIRCTGVPPKNANCGG